MKNIILQVIFFVFSMSLFSNNDVKLRVTANHANWIYHLNEKVQFSVSITEDNKPVDVSVLEYEIGPEKMPPIIKGQAKPYEGKMDIDGGTMKVPGFLRCRVKAHIHGLDYTGIATAAFSPDMIEPTTILPSDFMDFWNSVKNKNQSLPLDPQKRLLLDKCTDQLNVYEISMQNYQVGMRVYGILCVPKASGKYPAILELPGAGVHKFPGDLRLASHGIITLQIGIHGIPVTLDSIVYANLKYGALDGYNTMNLDSRDKYYYKHVFAGCIRAIDYIFAQQEFNGHDLIVEGWSQGGALSIVTAALDSRVKALVTFYPGLSDLNGYQSGRAGGWPHMFKDNSPKEKVEVSRYFDAVNFARFINVPGIYFTGFNDEVCPPTSIYSTFNSIKAPKTIVVTKENGHNTTPDQSAAADEFIFKTLKVR